MQKLVECYLNGGVMISELPGGTISDKVRKMRFLKLALTPTVITGVTSCFILDGSSEQVVRRRSDYHH